MYTAARMLQMKQHGGWNDKAKKPGRFPTLQSDLPVNKQARNESFSTDGNRFNLEPKQDAGPTENNIFFFFVTICINLLGGVVHGRLPQADVCPDCEHLMVDK